MARGALGGHGTVCPSGPDSRGTVLFVIFVGFQDLGGRKST